MQQIMIIDDADFLKARKHLYDIDDDGMLRACKYLGLMQQIYDINDDEILKDN